VVDLNKIERNHPLKMVTDFISFLPKYFALIILIGRSAIKEKDYLVFFSVLLIVFFIYFIFSFINFRKSTFILKEDSIFVQNGLINIKKSEILFERIHTLDITQNIIHRLLNIAILKIDTGSSAEKGSELKLVLNNTRAYELQSIIQGEKVEAHNEVIAKNINTIQLDSKMLLLYCVVSNSIFQSLVVIFTVFSFFQEYIMEFFNIDVSNYTSGLMGVPIGLRIFKIFALILLSIFISVAISIIMKFILYSGFKLVKEENKIKIQYGLINTKNYSLHRKKIKAVVLEQSLLMNKLGYATLKVESSGYGDEKNEDAILFPFIHIKDKDKLLEELLPEFVFKENCIKSPKKCYLSYLYLRIIFALIVSLLFIFISFKLLLISTLLIAILLFEGHLRYKNNGIGRYAHLYYMSSGGFSKKQTYIKEKSIQSITKSQNFFQKSKGVCNYTINLAGFLIGKDFTAKHIVTDCDDLILD
jgi:putative membrane protein